MRFKHSLAALLALSCLTAAHADQSAPAQGGFWHDRDGKPVTETESMRSKNGFAGSVLVTSDEDWEAKWTTSPDTTPNFKQATEIGYGKKVTILTFFANPAISKDGSAHVSCDIKLSGPDGKATLDKKDVDCFTGKLKGKPENLYLAAPVIGFSGDPGDAPGTWTAEITLHDLNRKVDLPLKTSFKLVK